MPASVIKLKKKEFQDLKQGNKAVGEYLAEFTQLSRYAPEAVDIDEKKQDLFLERLNEELQYQLMSHTFPTFQHMVDKAIVTENKQCELMEKNRKAFSQG